MRHPIAHSPHLIPWNLCMFGYKTWVLDANLRSCLTNNENIQNYGLLRFLVIDEVLFLHTICIPANKLDRVQHVAQIINKTIATLIGTHTGKASLRTRSRYFAGRSAGVSTSTGTPSSSSKPDWRPPCRTGWRQEADQRSNPDHCHRCPPHGAQSRKRAGSGHDSTLPPGGFLRGVNGVLQTVSWRGTS